MTIKVVSVDSVMLYFEQHICETVLDEVQQHYQALKGLKGITDLTPSYCSLLVTYDLKRFNQQSIQKLIQEYCSKDRLLKSEKREPKLITIPTDYTKHLDLERVAHYNHLSIQEVITLHTLHTQQTYRVYAIGFMVGFAYLAKVNSRIATPRLETPRAKIPKGSVAIADTQTAIYPQDSAGGWNIIGHTNFEGFDAFEVGDRVRFVEG